MSKLSKLFIILALAMPLSIGSVAYSCSAYAGYKRVQVLGQRPGWKLVFIGVFPTRSSCQSMASVCRCI